LTLGWQKHHIWECYKPWEIRRLEDVFRWSSFCKDPIRSLQLLNIYNLRHLRIWSQIILFTL
jgi:hypothetical protein